MSTELAIQVVNYNTKHYLFECLDTLFVDLRLSALRYTLSVLDNASHDDLSDVAHRYQGRPVSIRTSPKNLGFGGGHNLLARSANARYLLILNPDVKFIEPGSVERLLKRLKDTNAASVVGPRLVTAGGLTQPYDHGELHSVLARLALRSGGSYWMVRMAPGDVAWVSAAVFMVDKAIFDAVGGFDERFFLYKEEEDLCLRLRQRGARVIYDPTVSVIHYGSVVAKKELYMRQSVDYFLDKHFRGKLGYRVLKLWNKLVH